MRKFLASVFALVVAAGIGAGGYWWWMSHSQERTIEELRQQLDRMKADTLVADVAVVGQRTGSDGTIYTKLSFVEYGPSDQQGVLGQPIFKKTFEVAGGEFYIDALVVQFDDQFVQVGDGLRGKSLLLFRRAFGDEQRPVDGVELYSANDQDPIPEPLKVEGDDQFQRDLWARFWTLANDPAAAKAAGVRVAQGEAPHMEAQVGQVYELTMRASGGLTMTPRLPPAVQQAVGGAPDGGR
jgi:hypothetical protein